ncbi:50S ribosomal protein L17 [Candidatus Uzinura diaspidicola str. ASNER]|uniref:Large ribosomal subunit protein bL17 n=1 Tax=Candidatus Uzinura diaspidicola str. ASNER TaxID=1133592 RepID=L7VJP4_9FLAO|nr:50S ribosomal protein L17 [Candidatus Uzinura diaspidicola str. ASNER]
MRHKKKINHLGRKVGHRKNLIANMACSLITNKSNSINTTLSKAKELRKFIEPLFTISKNNNTHSHRILFSYLKSKFAIYHLFKNITPKIIERYGGYTRIIKIGSRLGDGAKTAIIELVV